MTDFLTCYQCDASWGPRSERAREDAADCPDCGTRLHAGLLSVPLRHLRVRMLGRDERRRSLALLGDLAESIRAAG